MPRHLRVEETGQSRSLGINNDESLSSSSSRNDGRKRARKSTNPARFSSRRRSQSGGARNRIDIPSTSTAFNTSPRRHLPEVHNSGRRNRGGGSPDVSDDFLGQLGNTPQTQTNARPSKQDLKDKKDRALFAEMHKLQKRTDNLVPKHPFSLVVREILLSMGSDLRITSSSLSALQEVSEIYLTQLFEDANRCTMHRGRVTLINKDIELVRFLRRRYETK